jgi:hypothetical protein
MRTRKFQGAFAGGEIAPGMLGRIEDVAFQVGAARIRNMLVRPQGSVVGRPGLRFLREAANSDGVALLRFRYSQGQNYAIEAGAGYYRLHTQGGTVRIPSTVYSSAVTVSGLDLGTETITTATPHGIVDGDLVEFACSGTFPTYNNVVVQSMGPSDWFYAKATTSTTMQLSLTSGGATLNLWATFTGTLTLRKVTREAGAPPRFVANPTISSIDTGTETITCAASHLLQLGDQVRVRSTGTNISIGGVVVKNTTTLYAKPVDFLRLQLTNVDGVVQNITAAGSGTVQITKVYRAGSLVLNGGSYHWARTSFPAAGALVPLTSDTASWYVQPSDGLLSIPHTHTLAQLQACTYSQNADVMTLAFGTAPAHELRRYGAIEWAYEPVQFSPTVPAVANLQVVPTYGHRIFLAWDSRTPNFDLFTQFESRTQSQHNLINNDLVYLEEIDPGGPGGGWQGPPSSASAGYFTVSYATPNTFRLQDEQQVARRWAAFAPPAPSTVSGDCYVRRASRTETETYRVTCVAPNGQESETTGDVSIDNDLTVENSYNTLSWTHPNAGEPGYSFRIYKKRVGVLGLIGSTDATTFRDDGIPPDIGLTLGIVDKSLNTDNPAAVGHQEQRRWFGGMQMRPQTILGSVSGRDGDYVYHIPLLDTDRIDATLTWREACAIRHIVPLQQMLVLTDSAEFRASPVNSDALTPDTIGIRTQSFVGCSQTRPEIVETNCVFEASRGGHLYAIGFRLTQDGYVPEDISFRASHLFDGHEITELSYGRAPLPLLWANSTSNLLLACTYIPEQQMAAWTRHDTGVGISGYADSVIESIVGLTEAGEDTVYAAVRRFGNLYIEYMAPVSTVLDKVDGIRLDSSLSFLGEVTDGATVTLAVAAGDESSGTLATITSSTAKFVAADATDGAEVWVRFGGPTAEVSKFLITTYTSPTQVIARSLNRYAVLGVAQSTWSIARKVFRGLDHLEGIPVYAVTNGVQQGPVTVASNTATFAVAGDVVHVGLRYTCELETLPMTVAVDAFSQGRVKNVNKAWLRTLQTERFQVGVPNLTMVQVAKQQDEHDMTLFPNWNVNGAVLVRQQEPYPIMVVGVAIEAEVT